MKTQFGAVHCISNGDAGKDQINKAHLPFLHISGWGGGGLSQKNSYECFLSMNT